MNATELLAQIFVRLESRLKDATTVLGSEADSWPAEAISHLQAAGVLRPLSPATVMCCPECLDPGPQVVFFREASPGEACRGQLFCPRCGLVELQPPQLARYYLDPSGLASFLCAHLGLAPPEELHPDRSWSLGALATDCGRVDLALVRGLSWPDAATILDLRQARHPLALLALLRTPTLGAPVVPLSNVLKLTSAGLVLDGERLRWLVAGMVIIDSLPYLFRREGEYWRIRFRDNPSTVKHRVGLSYILELLKHRGQKIPALTLYYAVSGLPAGAASLFVTPEARADDDSVPDFVEPGAPLTPEHTRALTINEELEEARQALDEEREEALLSELEAIEDLLARRARDSKVEPDPALENARLNVYQNIKRAFAAIAGKDQALASFLDDAITTGHSCSYDPTDPVPWEF